MMEESPTQPRAPEPEAAVGDVLHIDRDFSLRVPAFPTALPASLASRISAPQFSRTMEMLNTVLFEATEAAEEDATWRSLLSCFLLHLGPRIWQPPERLLYQRLSAFVRRENELTYAPAGLELRNPLTNGLLFVRPRCLSSAHRSRL